MAPLIVHGVRDDELYVGEDGVKRPYAVIYPHQEPHYRRRFPQEAGPFGKSNRRTRTRTATPGIGGRRGQGGIAQRREDDPTILASDVVFRTWFRKQAEQAVVPAKRPAISGGPSIGARPGTLHRPLPRNSHYRMVDDYDYDCDNLDSESALLDNTRRMQPTEVLLRGFRSSKQQYSAINHYEQLAGRILEDYPRGPDADQCRYQSGLRDRAVTAARRLTPAERACVARIAGGAHWVKVTFESAEAAEAAVTASPQTVLGHHVYAEYYNGNPPARDEPTLDVENLFEKYGLGDNRAAPAQPESEPEPAPAAPVSRRAARIAAQNASPPNSHASSNTFNTLDTRTTTITSGTVTASFPDAGSAVVRPPGMAMMPRASFGAAGRGAAAGASGAEPVPRDDNKYCRRIRTARRVELLPAEQALLPGMTWGQWLLATIPLLSWLTGSVIGDEVPRTELGDFDWNRASLYWKFICWLDMTFHLFGGEILSAADSDE